MRHYEKNLPETFGKRFATVLEVKRIRGVKDVLFHPLRTLPKKKIKNKKKGKWEPRFKV